MIRDSYGYPVFQENDIMSLLYTGNLDKIEELKVEPTPDIIALATHSGLGLSYASKNNLSVQEFDEQQQHSWFLPDEYRDFDPLDYCMQQCATTEEKARVKDEFIEFNSKGMIPLLQVLKYLVDTFRKNSIVWGVGRGSSVSSYALFLLGVHKIDSLKYSLDYREFLR